MSKSRYKKLLQEHRCEVADRIDDTGRKYSVVAHCPECDKRFPLGHYSDQSESRC